MVPRSVSLILGAIFLLALPSFALASGEAEEAQLPAAELAPAPVPRGEVPHIDVYTMGVGSDVTEKFGHAAVCTRYDKNPRRGRCYNYGTTNFEDPADVGWKFLRGRSRFWVSVVSLEAMLDLYVRRDRTVWVQELALTDAQARAVADKLHFDSLEANRYYRYHHYFDNCTTRIRDILDEHTGGVLAAESSTRIAPSFRDLSRRGFADSPGLLLASDYVLGRIGDRRPTYYEAMFLPEIFQDALRDRFGAEPVLIYERGGAAFSQTPGYGRLVVFFISVLLVAPLWFGFYRKRISRLQMAPAVVSLTLLGLLVWGLAALCPLPMARYNEALLLFFPLDGLLLTLGPVWRLRYAQGRVVIALLATAAAGIGVLEQPLWAIATLPVLALLPLALAPGRGGADSRA